jgi:tyrosyl-tRNA synthetase
MNVVEELRWRGMLYDMTEGAEAALTRSPLTTYCGFDAQGPSLHVGSLVPIMGLVHMQRHGHTPIALLGGGTSMIGDPSGHSKERLLLSTEIINANVAGIREQLSRFLDFNAKGNAARLVNNADWLTPLSLVEFLRDTGKHFSIGAMLDKESVKQRMQSEQGISFTEFSYMLLQSYDFLNLYRAEGCTLQVGGSDQWGNITAGVDLIRRVENGKAHGLVYPLITNASGEKFGKTANITGMDSVWLDPARTSPYAFYQFWFNSDDRDVLRNLKFFTLLDQPAIAELEGSLASAPERRQPHKRLAEEVTRTVHGETGLDSARKASAVLFGGEIEGLSAAELMGIFADVPSREVARDQLSGDGLPLVDLVVTAGFEASKARARTLIEGGGVSLNNHKMTDSAAQIGLDQAVEGKLLVLRKGKKDYCLIRLVG